MNISFEPLSAEYTTEAMDIFNYYIENSFAAFPENKLPYGFFSKILEMAGSYPALVIKDSNKVAGFCFLRAYSPFPTFKKTAEICYFIDKEYVGKGIGAKALELLENQAAQMGIKNILAEISSENKVSLAFHRKNGFLECGRFKNAGTKKGVDFDVVWMEKSI
ncbi:MAG: N-acetyltransferase family protein [Bacillota bacterium]|nr:N-acetyltransferase family protein [Bacillota bacterium]